MQDTFIGTGTGKPGTEEALNGPGMEEGGAAGQALEQTVCTKEEEETLIRRIADGDLQARDELVLRNQGLVRFVARKYLWVSDFSFEDLVSEGNLGLMRAVEKFDPEKGTRFSTYAFLWIRQAIMRAIETKGNIYSLPSHLYRIYTKAVSCAMEETGEPLRSLPWGTIEKYIRGDISSPVDMDVLINFHNLKTHRCSFDYKPDGKENSRADMLELVSPDVPEFNPVIKTEGQARTEAVEKTLGECLDEREQYVIKRRFGFYGETPTLEQVGESLGISRERVRQIEVKALRKLKHPKYIKQLKDFAPSI